MSLVQNSHLDYFNYKSHRRESFVNLFLSNVDYKETVINIVECIHTAATIIDDMQDNELKRKDEPCYYIRHGYATASFISLKLWQEAICIISEHYTLANFLPHLSNLILFQEADTGLSVRINATPLNWYFGNVSKKIGEELIIIYKLCYFVSEEDSDISVFIDFLTVIGQLIQAIDDKVDFLENYSYKENQNNNYCILTYSLPLACYLEYENDFATERLIGKPISFDQFDDIIKKIRVPRIITTVDNMIFNLNVECQKKSSLLSGNLQRKSKTIINFVNNTYW